MLYISSLDGLRLFAFLGVFIHHLPALKGSLLIGKLHSLGWIGVELFFVISSFLFFHLFEAEFKKTNTLNKRLFYIRRFLRIYPLMFAFSFLMLFFFKGHWLYGIMRFVLLSAGLDNFAVAMRGYSPIPFTAQLWTLSFEFQIYAIIPIAFLAYKNMEARGFFTAVFSVWFFCSLLRLAVVLVTNSHLPIWVMPPLRPDSVIVGFLLPIFVADMKKRYVIMALFISTILFLLLPPMESSRASRFFVFPLVAIMCGSIVALAITWRPIIAFLSNQAIAFAGTISFGLYVYHFLGIALAGRLFKSIGWVVVPENSISDYAIFACTAFGLTFIIASVSFLVFEKRILKLKDRFALVHGKSV